MTIINYVVLPIIISSLFVVWYGNNQSLTGENHWEIGKDMCGRPVSVQKNDKWILALLVDLVMLVHVNLTQFSCGWLVRGEVDNRSIGQWLRESSRVVLPDRTHGLHGFTCNKFLSWKWFFLQRLQNIIKLSLEYKALWDCKIRGSPTTEAVHVV